MDQTTEYALARNRTGYWEIRWSEPDPANPGKWRSRTKTTRQTDRRDAETVLNGFLQAVRDADAAEAARVAAAAGVSVGFVLDRYEAMLKRKGSTSQAPVMRRVRAAFGAVPVTMITNEVVQDYADTRRKRHGKPEPLKDNSLRREFATLLAVMRWGKKNKLFVGDVPHIEVPPAGPPRTTWLNEIEAGRLFAAASGDVGRDGRLSPAGLFVCIALETGARSSAVTGLTWDRVDLSGEIVDFRDPAMRVTKKRRAKTTITPRLLPVLRRAFAERVEVPPTRYVLGVDPRAIRDRFDALMRRHGFGPEVTPHVLRHTRITLLLRAKVNPWDVSALVGVDPNTIFAVYGHHIVDDRLRALAVVQYGAG